MTEIIFYIVLMLGAAFFIKRKTPVFLVIFLMGIAVFFFNSLKFSDLLHSSGYMFFEEDFIYLLLNIQLIFIFGGLLNKSGKLNVIADILLKMLPSRIAITILPMIMGFFPMPGGALFTLDFVKKVGFKSEIDKNVIAFANYWFRHVWEFVYPVYPGFILFYTILNIKITDVIKMQYPLTIVMITSGFFFLYMFSKAKDDKKNITLGNIFNFFKSVWFIYIIFLFIIFDKPVWIALFINIFLTIFLYKMKKDLVFGCIKKSLNINVLLTLYTVYFFKEIIAVSPLADNILIFAAQYKTALPVLIIFFPFIIGYLTGITTTYVGICFPVLFPFFSENILYAPLAYASGFAGVLLTPVHLCLSMTTEVLKAEYSRINTFLYPLVTILLIVAVYLYFL